MAFSCAFEHALGVVEKKECHVLNYIIRFLIATNIYFHNRLPSTVGMNPEGLPKEGYFPSGNIITPLSPESELRPGRTCLIEI